MDDAAARAAENPPGGARSRRRRAGISLGWLAFAAVLVPAIARLVGFERGPLAIAAALMPWVTLACLVPLAFAWWTRSWTLLTTSAAVALLCVSWQVPMWTPAADGGEADLSVATLNVTFGRADPASVVALAEQHDLDLLALQEVTAGSVQALRGAGLEALMPYTETLPAPGFEGVALWSAHPIERSQALGGFVSNVIQAEVALPAGSTTVLVVHPAAPGPVMHPGWDADLEHLREVLEGIEGPVLVLGDFNATRDHRGFRDIEALGYTDAATQAGAGFLPTFPEGRSPFPVVAIDHALVRDARLSAVTTATASVPGADHRALIVGYSTG